jgi:hypothetical protein
MLSSIAAVGADLFPVSRPIGWSQISTTSHTTAALCHQLLRQGTQSGWLAPKLLSAEAACWKSVQELEGLSVSPGREGGVSMPPRFPRVASRRF